MATTTTDKKHDPLGELVERLRGITTNTTTRAAGKPWEFGEAADHLGVSVKHLRHLADLNKIDTIKIGRRKRLIADKELRRVEREGV